MATQVNQRVSGSGKTVIDLYFESDNGIVIGLNSAYERVHNNLENYMQGMAEEIENYMKTNHPWKNRTYRAEKGLHTEVEGDNNSISIGLYHSEIVWPWYGIHLEYGMGRRFAIIEPTQKFYGPKVLNEIDMFQLYRFTKNVKR